MTSHSRTVPSRLPLASVRPSGLNATALTTPSCRSGAGRAGGGGRDRRRPTAGPCRRRSPLASVRPSGLNATVTTETLLVVGWPSGRGCAGSATSHSRTAPSLSPLASVCPSGLNATDSRRRRRRLDGSGAGRAGGGARDRRRPTAGPCRRALPLASVRPSGLNATERTLRRLPVRGWPSGRGCAGSATSHSRIVPSASAAGQRVPVGAERHRFDARRCCRSGAGRAGGGARDRRRPTAGPRRRRRRWPAFAHRG